MFHLVSKIILLKLLRIVNKTDSVFEIAAQTKTAKTSQSQTNREKGSDSNRDVTKPSIIDKQSTNHVFTIDGQSVSGVPNWLACSLRKKNEKSQSVAAETAVLKRCINVILR